MQLSSLARNEITVLRDVGARSMTEAAARYHQQWSPDCILATSAPFSMTRTVQPTGLRRGTALSCWRCTNSQAQTVCKN
jgi:hypothetical protein